MPICEMSYSFDSTSKFFRQTVTTPVITTKRLSVECFRNWRNHPKDVNLITYSREIESVVSQRVPRLSIICGLKLLLPDVLFKKCKIRKLTRYANENYCHLFLHASVCLPNTYLHEAESFVTIFTQKLNKFLVVSGPESGHSNMLFRADPFFPYVACLVCANACRMPSFENNLSHPKRKMSALVST